MTSKPWARLTAALFATALVAASCGSSSTTTEATDTTEAGATEADSTDTTEAGDTDTTEAGDTDTTEADATEGAMADGEVGSISADNILTGPGGMTIDLNECPSDWDNTQGVTDTEILLGMSNSFSGNTAAFGGISDGMEAYMDWVSTEHPEYFGGRTIRMEILDDAYEPARTVTNIQQLVEQDGMFMTAANLGTPNNLAVYDYLNEQCVPHLWAVTGHPAFGDPANHPWSTPSFLSYVTEGRLWGDYIKAKIDSGELEAPATVGMLVLNSDVGGAWLLGWEAFLEENPGLIEVVEMERYEVTAPNLTNEMTTVASSEADVFIGAAAAVACTQAAQEMSRSSWEPKVKIVSSVCSTLSYWEPLGQDAGEGWVLTQDRKALDDDALYGDDPFIQDVRAAFEERGADYRANSFVGWAVQFAVPTVEALKVANDMPGGITRTNVIAAAWGLDFEHPYLLENANFTLNGLEDPYGVETAQFAEYKIEPGETVGSFIPFGDVVGENATTPPCAWDGSSCG